MENNEYRTLNNDEISSILKAKKTCKLAVTDGKEIYIIPMWYLYKDSNVYLLTQETGNCLENIKSSQPLSIFIDNTISSFYQDAYDSITAKGSAEILEDEGNEKAIMKLFIDKYGSRLKKLNSDKFTIIKISVSELLGREYNF